MQFTSLHIHPSRSLYSLLFVVLFSCATPPAEVEVQVNNDLFADSVPSMPDTVREEAVIEALHIPAQYHAQWVHPPLARWDAWEVKHHSDSTGGVRERHADFDGDGREDAAFFLRNRGERSVNRKDSTYAVVVVFGAGGDTLLGPFSWAEAMGNIGAGLELYQPRTLHHLGDDDEQVESPLVLEHAAICLMYFGKSEVTWFWRKGRFHRIWTSD